MIYKKIIWLLIIALLSVCFMAFLYKMSDKQSHKANPFIRKYIRGSAELQKRLDLRNRTMYFIGSHKDKIYLGDSQAPLYVFVFDTLLKSKQQFKIELDNDRFPFINVQLRIAPPYFYVLDGTVPIIYRGLISNWEAKTMGKGGQNFTHAEIINEGEIAVRSFTPRGQGTQLGKITLNDSLAYVKSTEVLQKQIDGYFDVDGIMKYDAITRQLMYLYYYRNQFVITDENLEVRKRGNTIDTNSIAKLKVSYNPKTGLRQMASPSATVNRLLTISNNLAYINSTVPGKWEDTEMWQQAGIIDVYNITDNRYRSSFYVYKFDESIRDILVDGKRFYAIVGHHLHHYKLSNQSN